MIKRLAFLFFALASITAAQGFRFDSTVQQQGTIGTTTNAVLLPAAPQIAFCISPANAVPCTNKATTYTSKTLATPCSTSTQIVLPNSSTCVASPDAQDNWGVWVAAGNYAYTITLPGGINLGPYELTLGTTAASATNLIGPGTITGNYTHSGTETFTGPVTVGNGSSFSAFTFSNHNNTFWAGPGATPTIDQAVAQCTSLVLPCFVEISAGYTGVESTNIVTTSMGYKVYSGANNVTVVDHRQVDSGSGNPTGTNLYGVMYGGRNAGALNRIACNYYANNATDSTTCSNSFNWVTGTFAQNTGAMNGAVSFTATVGSVTIGANGGIVDAQDGESYHNATSVDRDLSYITGFTGQSGMSRSNAVGNITTASAYLGNGCANVSSTAKIGRCYVFDSLLPSVGVSENYGYHNNGSWLSESTQTFDYVAAGFSITAASEASSTVTITTSSTCPFITGDRVRISGVGGISATVVGYNGVWTVLTPGCNGGSTFTYTNTTTGLSTLGAGGTVRGLYSALSWGGNGGLTISGSNAGGVLFNPGAVNAFRILPNVLTSFVAHQFNAAMSPSSAAGTDIGTTGLPFANLWIGTAATNNWKFQPGATSGARVITMTDPVSPTTVGLPFVIASGTSTMTSGAIAGATCQTAVTTSATGTATTDSIEWAYATAPTGTTDALLHISQYVTVNNVNFTRCNPTAASITGTAIVINWRVIR